MNKDETLARLTKAVNYLKYNGQARKQEKMTSPMGIGQPHLAVALNGDYRRLIEGFEIKFAVAYSAYIHELWLLTGDGEMAKPLQVMKPHVQAKAEAGFMNTISEGEYGKDLRPAIPFFRNYDFTIEVQGRSMLLDYREGDTLACRISKDRLNHPIGKICVIDGHEGAAVKVIAGLNENKTAIICHSLNTEPQFADYETEFENINQIAGVVGMIRPEEW